MLFTRNYVSIQEHRLVENKKMENIFHANAENSGKLSKACIEYILEYYLQTIS